MSLYRVFFDVYWHDRCLDASYYLISAKSEKEARGLARQKAFDELAPSPKSKLSIRTSMKSFVRR
jgi:hypothetical protein